MITLTPAQRRLLDEAAEWTIVGSADRRGYRYASAQVLAAAGLVRFIQDKHVTRMGGGWGAASYATTVEEHVWRIRITDEGLEAVS